MVAKKRTTEKTSTNKKTSNTSQVSPSKKTTIKGSTSKTSARKRTTAKKSVKKATASKRKGLTDNKALQGKKMTLTPEQRYLMIQEEAYYVAERAKWTQDPTECWIEAERLVAERISP